MIIMSAQLQDTALLSAGIVEKDLYRSQNKEPAERLQQSILDTSIVVTAEAAFAAAEATIEAPSKTLKAFTIKEFLSMNIALKDMILSPIIPAGGLGMLFAQRGIGKTHLALGIAYAVASGGRFLKWEATKQHKVLVVDGEMPARSMQERLALLVESNEIEVPPDHLRIITPDLQDSYIPDLSSVEGQAAIEQHLEGVDLIILDNLSTFQAMRRIATDF